MSWYLDGNVFTEEQIENHIGFIYEIEEISTGRKYIGQKVFFNKVTKNPLKGKVNKRRSKKQSDWLEYYGSNDELKKAIEENGTENYKRSIIRLCKSKAEMNYWESFLIFNTHALLKEEYFNSWIKTRINSNQLKKFANEFTFH